MPALLLRLPASCCFPSGSRLTNPLFFLGCARQAPHRALRQGIGAGFIPGNLDVKLLDETIKVSPAAPASRSDCAQPTGGPLFLLPGQVASDDAVAFAKRMALEEGE